METKFSLFKGYLLLIVLLAIYVIYASVTYKSFGITADENSAYISGDIWYHHYINEKSDYDFMVRYNPIINEHNRFYVTVLYAITQSLNYDMYHYLNLIFTIPIFIFAFIFTWKYYKKVWTGGLVVLFMFLTPRFLGDIPANPKDVPFAVAYFISTLLIFISTTDFFKKYPYLKIILIGGFMGYTQSLRAVGFTLYPVLFLWTLINHQSLQGINIKSMWAHRSILMLTVVNVVLETITTFIVSLFVMCVIWPAIGYNFFANFKKYLVMSSGYELWDGKTLFNGTRINAAQIPIYYMPLWVLLSTPIIYLILILKGFYLIFKKFSSTLQRFTAALIVYNFVIYFVVRPVSYNGIRHFLFLVVMLTFFAGITFIEIVSRLSLKKNILFISIVFLYLAFTTYKIYRLFPYQYTYFNEFLGSYSNAAAKFDLDYWGTTYIEGADVIKKLAKNSPDDKLKYYTCKMGFAMDYYLEGIANRVEQQNHADYLVCDAEGYHDKKLDGTSISDIARMGYVYETVYKRNPKQPTTVYKPQ